MKMTEYSHSVVTICVPQQQWWIGPPSSQTQSCPKSEKVVLIFTVAKTVIRMHLPHLLFKEIMSHLRRIMHRKSLKIISVFA